jgi:hypothetical protein
MKKKHVSSCSKGRSFGFAASSSGPPQLPAAWSTPTRPEPAWMVLNPAALNVEHGVRDHARALLDQTRACSTWLTLW